MSVFRNKFLPKFQENFKPKEDYESVNNTMMSYKNESSSPPLLSLKNENRKARTKANKQGQKLIIYIN